MSKENKKSIFSKIKNVKHIEIIVAVIAVIIMLIIYFTTFISPSNKTESKPISDTDYCEMMRGQIEDAISNLKGAGKAKVVINWSSSVENVIAYITSSNGNTVNSTPQILQSQGANSPLILKQIYPKAIGVVIICQGGDNVKTKIEVKEAISTLLDITVDKITVYAMK